MRDLYIVGAGASASDGVPTIRDFRKFAERLAIDPSRPPSDRFLGDVALRDRFWRACETWGSTFPFANTEEYYAAVELAAQLDGAPEGQDPLGNVQYLIAKTIASSVGKRISIPYSELTNRLFANQDVEQPSIISLNWDTLLESAISPDYAKFLDYCYPRAKERPNDVSPSPSARRLRVMKLHGSMNWWFCDVCETLWYYRGLDVLLDYWENPDWPCEDASCTGAVSPVFVPPTVQKISGRPQAALRSIWKEARLALSSCDRLTIVGYSFPRADLQFKMMLNEALVRNPGLKAIRVVSEPKIGTEHVRFEDHYHGQLPADYIDAPIRFIYEPFETWARGSFWL